MAHRPGEPMKHLPPAAASSRPACHSDSIAQCYLACQAVGNHLSCLNTAAAGRPMVQAAGGALATKPCRARSGASGRGGDEFGSRRANAEQLQTQQGRCSSISVSQPSPQRLTHSMLLTNGSAGTSCGAAQLPTGLQAGSVKRSCTEARAPCWDGAIANLWQGEAVGGILLCEPPQ